MKNIKELREKFAECQKRDTQWKGYWGYKYTPDTFEEWVARNYPEEINQIPAYISLDSESDGLWGPSFCIAVTLYNLHGVEIGHHVFTYEHYEEDIKNSWVKENVLPAIQIPGDAHCAESRLGMLKEFSEFWLQHKDLSVMWHMGHVVEAGLFRELRQLELIGDFDAPYTPIEIASILQMKGFAPDSVDAYAESHQIKVVGSTHDPLYDCRVAAAVYFDLVK